MYIDKDKGYSNLVLFQYKSIDDRIQSPFSVTDGGARNMVLTYIINMKNILNSCSERNTTSRETIEINTIFFRNIGFSFINETNVLRLDYKIDMVSNGAKFKMDKVYVIDFENTPDYKFISLYGCIMLNIDGKLKKFEGVQIFSSFHLKFYNPLNKFDAILNNTYSFLEDNANISKHSLKFYLDMEDAEDENSCSFILHRSSNYMEERSLEIFVVATLWIILLGFSFYRFRKFLLSNQNANSTNKISPKTLLPSVRQPT